MLPRNGVALREWSAVCDRLRDGSQVLLLRSGGIHERRFVIEQRELWLWPTVLHQAAGHLRPAERASFEAGPAPARAPRIDLYAEIVDATWIADPAAIARLEPFHPWTGPWVDERFRRRGGLWALVLRTHRAPAPVHRAPPREDARCVSWVDLEPAIDTAGVSPVLDEARFAAVRAAIRAAWMGEVP